MRGWSIVVLIGAALLTTPATAQVRAAHSAPARVARPAPSARSSVVITTTTTSFVPNRPFFVHHQGPFFRTYPWWPYYSYYGGYSYPMFWGSSYGSDQGASAYPQYQVQQEMSDLYNEFQRLREQQVEATAAPPPQPSVQPQAPSASSQPTTLVFRDGKTEQVQNYAIVGKTLWVFNERRARKILLSELNISATQKANEDHGVEFAIPE